MAYKTTNLYKACEAGDFWTLPESRVLEIIRDAFPAEFDRLKRAYASPRAGIKAPDSPSISIRLFDEDFPEVNRTLVGVLALRWIYHDEYNTFIGSQPPVVALKRNSFKWMRDTFFAYLKTPEDLYLLILSMIINDLGKDPELATDYASLAHVDAPHANHDILLYLAVKAGMVDALRDIPDEGKARIMAGISLGASFNFGQLAQAENVPASLSGLHEMRESPEAFDLHFLEQILDVSGASGHEDWTCARKLIEPIFQSYKTVYETAEGVISGKWDLQQGYDAVLSKRGRRVEEAGFTHSLDSSNTADRAMLRLFCLGNVSDKHLAEVFWNAFHDGLTTPRQKLLICGLNRHGEVGEPAVQPTYMPAMFTKALAKSENLSETERINVVTVLMDYLTHVLQVSPEELDDLPKDATVIERDVRVIEDMVKTEDFGKNPESYKQTLHSLEYVPVPTVANRCSDPGGVSQDH